MFILVIDIGGTNPRMAMMEDFTILSKKSIENHLILEINDFLKQCADSGWTTDACCVCVAGIIENGRCDNPTNVSFLVSAQEIQENTLLSRVILINDFEALGHACVHNPDTNTPLAHASFDPQKNCALIGPGTGLGVAYVSKEHSTYEIHASEGGHAGFPLVAKFMHLFVFAANHYQANELGMESLASGRGIQVIYKFLQKYPAFSEQYLKRKFKNATKLENPTAQQISEYAYTDAKCYATMCIFMELFGYAAQSVALHGLPKGGLFIVGGIIPKNLDFIENGLFYSSFTDNWRPNIKSFLESVPIFVVKDYDTSLYGCVQAFKHYME